MQNVISKLVKQKEELEHDLTRLSTAIEALQNVCPHLASDGISSAMSSLGYGSHKEYFKCTICGWEDSL